MLIDRCVIEVRSGKGGDGAISFLQDKNTQKGGPDGGNGGRGGSIFFVASKNINTLYTFRHSKAFIAENGEKGKAKNMYGHNAPDIYVQVPCGTLITDEATGEALADLTEEGQTACLAKGGRGGRGNACFKSSRHRVPRISENGHPGERKRLILELKMLADAGLVGFPSVGKSSFLNIATRANVPVADYPFTTLAPNLGVVNLKDGNSFVLADLPGLIEGAHEGRGLGMVFLRHIERCRLIIHLVAMNGEKDPYESYLAIRKELTEYGAHLEDRPEIVVASMMDLEGAEELKKGFDKKLGFESYPLCSFTHEGLDKILTEAKRKIDETPFFPIKGVGEEGIIKVYDAHKDGEDFDAVKIQEGVWKIEGKKLELRASLINTSTEEGEEQLIKLLNSVDVDSKLKEAGAKDGDEVWIGDFAFTYDGFDEV